MAMNFGGKGYLPRRKRWRLQFYWDQWVFPNYQEFFLIKTWNFGPFQLTYYK